MTLRRIVLVSALALLLGCPAPKDKTATNPPPPAKQPTTPWPQEIEVPLDAGSAFILQNGERYHADFPDTFSLPPADRRRSLEPGTLVKLMFRIAVRTPPKDKVERMWVIVKGGDESGYVGVLDNDSATSRKLAAGVEVRFAPRHVIQIDEEYRVKPDGEAERREPDPTPSGD